MKKLNKEQTATRDRLIGELEAAQVALERATAAYKAKLVEAQEFCSGVADEIQSYMDDKSDKWHDGDRGQAYAEWQGAWGDVEFPELEELSERAAEILGALDSEPNT